MPLGHSAWNLATILSVSAGILEAADESGLIMTVVPGLALNGWEGLVSFDAGAGVGFFSRQKFGEQDFGGPVQLSATMGARINPFSHAYAGLSIPTLLRCRLIRTLQSRRGLIHHRIWLPVLIRILPDYGSPLTSTSLRPPSLSPLLHQYREQSHRRHSRITEQERIDPPPSQ